MLLEIARPESREVLVNYIYKGKQEEVLAYEGDTINIPDEATDISFIYKAKKLERLYLDNACEARSLITEWCCANNSTSEKIVYAKSVEFLQKSEEELMKIHGIEKPIKEF